jgi:signal transduction histidine kinase
MHRLLKRQIRRCLGQGTDVKGQPVEMRRLLALVDEAYQQSDEDRRMLERSLDLSSDELLKANGELNALFASLPDLFLRVTREGRLVDIKGGADDHVSLTTGASAGDAMWQALIPSAASAIRDAFDVVVDQRRAAVVEYETGDEESRYFEARLRPLPRGDVMVVIRDVTDRVDAIVAETARREQVARGDALEEFAYVASHDLRAPLRAIGHLAEWIEEDFSELASADAQKRVGLLRRRVKRMDDLLVALLDYARVGRSDVVVEEVEVGALVLGVVDMLGNDLFTFDIVDLPTIHSARGPLERVFLNLITNAVKHHDRRDGLIRVGCTHGPRDGFVGFYVEDDGPGIPQKARERVFKMFQKLASRDEVEGSGMGLALIRRIVNEAGGEIELTDAPDGGARFTFTWPRSWHQASGESG